MSTTGPADASPAVECFADCPYFETVTGRCTHESNQALRQQFVDDPDTACPIYVEWDGK